MKDPIKDLAEIKSMMERSTRFLSLSGLAGVLAGVYALFGVSLAYYWLHIRSSPFGIVDYGNLDQSVLTQLTLTAIGVLTLSIATAWLLSQKKSKKTSNQLWTPASKRFMQALFIPVVIGGMFCVALLHQGFIPFVAPATLVFYGLGLLNASQFTLNEIKYLGYCQSILGVIASFFPEFGFLIWALGFGVIHIFYGSMMYFKYDR
jgi:predicted lysophospholipase L1 biosynthesis ABC-type transport system permease subunit